MNQDRASTITNSQLKEGYKQTEVGIIPEDWTIESIQEFANIKTGPFGTLLKASEYAGYSGVPLISVGEIRNGFFRITEHTPFVPEIVVRRLPQYVLRKGDIVFGRKGAVERSALVEAEQEGWFLGSDGISIRPSIKCHAKYLAFQFQSHRVISWLIQNAIGTTMASLNQEILSKVVIPLPPTKTEQEAIACTLRDIDALIESLDRLLTKKRQIKQGAMQELLRSKDGWVEKKLSEIAEIRSGGTPSTSRYEFWDGDILWCTPTDITALKGYKYLVQTSRLITLQGLNSSSAEMIPANSVVMTSRATIGECAINRVTISTNQGFKNFVPLDGVDVEFLYYLLQTQKQNFISLCGGSTFLEIGKNQLSEFMIELPKEKSEQIEIANILSDVDAEIDSISAKLTKTHQLKQGMMHELLTGRIRLVD
jgi:type I restriction enzyme, S subunit